MQISITTFGQLAERISPKIILENIVDTNMLKQKLEEKYSSLRNAKYIIAVDRKVIIKNTVINETSDVALLPPFSGG